MAVISPVRFGEEAKAPRKGRNFVVATVFRAVLYAGMISAAAVGGDYFANKKVDVLPGIAQTTITEVAKSPEKQAIAGSIGGGLLLASGLTEAWRRLREKQSKKKEV